MKGTLRGVLVVACSFEFSFIGAPCPPWSAPASCAPSRRASRRGLRSGLFPPPVGWMQEALFSLMQMAKTSAAF